MDDHVLLWHKATQCLNIFHDLSSTEWCDSQRNRMESWIKNAHVIDDSWPYLDSLVGNDSEMRKMLGEVLDVIIRHLRILHEMNTSEKVRGIDELLTSEHEDGLFRHEYPRPSSEPLVENISLTMSDSAPRVHRSTSEAPPMLEPSQYEFQDTISHWSGFSAYSARSAQSNMSVVILLRPGVEQSKKMVERFIKRLFDVTNSGFLTPEKQRTNSPQEEIFSEDSFTNFAYQQIVDTVSRLVPLAKNYIWHRIARASTGRLRDRTEARKRLGLVLNEPYFPGKYISQDPHAFDYILRRTASVPPDLEVHSPPAWTYLREARRHQTFPPYLTPHHPLHMDIADELWGVGAAYSGNTTDINVEPTEPSFTSDVSPIPPLHLYICFVESCPTPYDLHESAKNWENHLYQNHPEVLNSPTWMCTAWSHAPNYPHFSNELSFQHHMYEKHADSFDPDILPDLVDACYQPPKSIEACPFCNDDWNESSDHQTSDSHSLRSSFLKHVLAHLDEITLKIFYSLPLYDQGTNEVAAGHAQFEQVKHAASEIGSNIWISDTLGPLQPLEDCLQI
ncbi:hypothetical protein N431DRAFT_425727 [Stipitochalara longipes BDJ]|nr:hypothetical protein N431DRAFT_425727 [Stipitochalara longipes BDJ]